MAAKKAAKPTMAQAFKAAQKSVPTKIAPPRGGGGGAKPPKGPVGQAEDAIEQAVKDAADVIAGVIKNAGKGADKVGDKVASIVDGAIKALTSTDGKSWTESIGSALPIPGKGNGKGKGKGKSMIVPEPKAPKRGGERTQPPGPGEYLPRPKPTLPETK